jgi:hypothetical protein
MLNIKKERIVEAIQQMDSFKLSYLLDDDTTYSEAAKEAIVEKLHDIFNELRGFGDSNLLAYEGSCNAKACTNFGCSGYSFVGNYSKKHIDLIFEEEDDEVSDLYQCIYFAIDGNSIELAELLEINIKEDDKANFKPSTEFLIKSQKVKLAYEELMQYKDIAIDKAIYNAWLEKYDELYQSEDFPIFEYSNFEKFQKLYCEVYMASMSSNQPVTLPKLP